GRRPAASPDRSLLADLQRDTAASDHRRTSRSKSRRLHRHPRRGIALRHRMRGLSDAVVGGAGTVAADDPQLTTRHVPGPSPLRVVLDPTRRLNDRYRVFNDPSAETLYVCAKSLMRPG